MKEILFCILVLVLLAAFVLFAAFLYVALVLWAKKNSGDLDFDDDYIDIDE